MANQQRIIHFFGTVQGVGFRYTACRIADQHDLCGYVRNLPDGGVECVVEGSGEKIDAFLSDLAQAFGGYIRRTTQQTAPLSGQYRSFDVTY